MDFLPQNILINFLVLAVSFYILAKSADFLVDGATGLAYKLNIPKIIIGIVLVGFATTAPEFTVSMISAIKGHPEIALGNAVGSVITDDALALALGIIVAPAAIKVDSRVLKNTGIFLICIDVIAFFLSMNGIIGRGEGIFLLIILVLYLVTLVIYSKKRRDERLKQETDNELFEHIKSGSLSVQIIRFCIGIAGVLLASEFLIESSLNIAGYFHVPEVIIGLTIIAIGTSLPEIATCISASRKGHGDLALGDILGADILNILWIIGAASSVKTITVEKSVIFFMFPVMIVVVLVMLLFARHNFRLEKWNGIVLLILYAVYLSATIIFF